MNNNIEIFYYQHKQIGPIIDHLENISWVSRKQVRAALQTSKEELEKSFECTFNSTLNIFERQIQICTLVLAWTVSAAGQT